jgi:two-component system phosphate regulon sensor histidine kinase PhoR
MGQDPKAKTKRPTRSLSLTGVIVALSVGVLFPVLASTAVGIVTLARQEGSSYIVIGVLVISFAAAAIGSAIVATVLVGKKARLARLQSDLLANVTHDLRTPLAAIRMYAQTLRSGKLNEDSQRTEESLDTILRETERLEAMIERVLTWRAASKDLAPLDMKVEPVENAVDAALRRFTRMTAPGEVELSRDITSDTPVLHDAHAISSVILNLLVNAYKYTGSKKTISVRVEERDGQVLILVKDNGIGIARREARRIFEPFYRVDSQLKGKSSGAGLGLAIARHLVKAHDGDVTVESQEGRGSSFIVSLPEAK